MTVGELKKALEEWPDDTVVYVDYDAEQGGNEDTPHGLVPFNEAWAEVAGVKIT